MVSGKIWYHLTWQMMLDIMKCIKLLPLQNNYPAARFICHNFEINWYIDIKKVQVHVADEIKRDICLYLVYIDVADDA